MGIDTLHTTEMLFTTNKFVRDFCLLGEYVGLEREKFASKLGLSLKSIHDPEIIISKYYIFEAYNILLEHTDDELFGVGIKNLPRGSVDLMVKAAVTEPTLGKAISEIDKVIKIAQGPLKSKIIVNENLVRWQITPKVKNAEFLPLLSSKCSVVAFKLLSVLARKEIPLEYVTLAEKSPDNKNDFQFLYSCPLRFNAPHYEIVFEEKWLQEPVRCNYVEIKEFLKQPLSLGVFTHKALGLTSQIKDILSASPYAQFPNQSELSKQLGMSVRTLQRKLDMENTSYMQLKDDVRFQKAVFYLEHTKKDLNEIAVRCGFSERASFTRSFERWSGYLPSKYQR